MKLLRKILILAAVLLSVMLLGTAEELTVYPVSLPEGFVGEATAVHGEDYCFRLAEEALAYYDYQFSATMDGRPVTVIPQNDGTYLIRRVSGVLVVEAVGIPQTFSVTVTGDGAAYVTYSTPAIFNTDYSFLADSEKVTVQITVDGQLYDHELVMGEEHTVLGWHVRGNIVIKATKIMPMMEVSFSGSGAEAISGKNQVKGGEYYRFTLKKERGYAYEITALMGGTEMELVSNGVNSWLVGPVSEPLEIVAERTEQTTEPRPAVPGGTQSGTPGTSAGGQSGSVGGSTAAAPVVTIRPVEQEPQVLPFEEVPLPEEQPEPEPLPVPEPEPESIPMPELPDVTIGQLPRTEETVPFPWWTVAACGGSAMALLVVGLLVTRKNVVFVTGSRTVIRPRKVRRGRLVSRPPEPRKYGAVFAGWFVDEARTKRWIFEEYKVRDHMTLYAKWV